MFVNCLKSYLYLHNVSLSELLSRHSLANYKLRASINAVLHIKLPHEVTYIYMHYMYVLLHDILGLYIERLTNIIYFVESKGFGSSD
jgi:hypothetical protein